MRVVDLNEDGGSAGARCWLRRDSRREEQGKHFNVAPRGAATELNNQTPGLALEVQAFPPADGGEPYILASANYALAVSADSDDAQKQAALDFLAWVAEPENAAEFTKVEGGVPISGPDENLLTASSRSGAGERGHKPQPQLEWPERGRYEPSQPGSRLIAGSGSVSRVPRRLMRLGPVDRPAKDDGQRRRPARTSSKGRAMTTTIGTTVQDDAAGAGGGRTSRPRRNRPLIRYGYWWWALPAIVAVLLIHYIATAGGAYYAFTDWTGIGDYNFVGLENFQRIFDNPELVKSLQNTLFLAFGFLIATNVGGLLLALALNRTLKTRYVLRVLFFMPVVLSPLAVSYIWKFIFDFRGPLNQVLGWVGMEPRTWLAIRTLRWGVLVVMAWQTTGLVMVIYLAGWPPFH